MLVTRLPDMGRFFITVIAGALVYTAGSAITPQEDSMAVIIAPISGAILTAVLVAAILLPLRAGLRVFAPGAAHRTHAVVVAGLLLALVTVFSLVLSADSLPHGRLGFWALWACYALAPSLSFFWPLAPQNRAGADSRHETAACPPGCRRRRLDTSVSY
jgi:hypothetical protein